MSKVQKSDLVDISTINPRIILDIRYATTNNFTKQKIYDSPKCYARKHVALKLDAVQKELEKQVPRLGLKIWDVYRPLSAQKKMWAVMPDQRYVMPPEKGSRHNRGCAVDLTLVDKNGNELEMPTEFDTFTKQAHRDYMDLPSHVIKNRQLLEDVMVKHGFVGMPTEWWHFDDVDWKKYDLLDISI